MGWFTRKKEGISTSTAEKKETPEGLWYKCPKCKSVITSEEHKRNFSVCKNCNHHERVTAADYFEILFDSKKGTGTTITVTIPARFIELNVMEQTQTANA